MESPAAGNLTGASDTIRSDSLPEMLDRVDWSLLWNAPWRDTGQRVQREVASGFPLCESLNRAGSAPVRFVPQADLPPTVSYEQFICTTGTCPTRPGLHDFFNGLCWITFPATKTRLNHLQAREIHSAGIGPVRGATRDALTLFDENAALLQAPQVLWDALVAKRWDALFGTLRPLWRESQLVVFGHALLEKLQAPRKAITAHVYRVLPPADSFASLDQWLADTLDGAQLARKPFAHLPLLGVPGWWAENENPDFYRDPSVFRAPQPDA